ncbi:glycosyltransferase family 25 protein [uncultured Veillonella sp.]|uniref:glycosyltransferase family 25 protein n=1 Tax=uncultured Veillonella sp. TaxID=159268 RepID=UPI0025DB76D6|nr:glycosyltransferase family 25 protein [uncultured Veillonella sp.]
MYYYFISNKNNIERRENVAYECKKIGVEPIFFDAIMGDDLSADEIGQNINKDIILGKPEIGCALSHLEIIKRFLASQEEVLFVFEDDIGFCNDIAYKDFQEIEDFVRHQEKPAALCLYKSSYQFKQVKSLSNCRIYSAFSFTLAHAYVINRAAAEIIVELQTPINFEIDVFQNYYLLKGCQLYSLDKDLVVQKNCIQSTIGEERARRNREFKKHKKGVFFALYKSLSLKEKMLFWGRKISKEIYRPFRPK